MVDIASKITPVMRKGVAAATRAEIEKVLFFIGTIRGST
jgi:hypothetical protein